MKTISDFEFRNSDLKAVLFDFGGTLDSDGIPWKERFFRLWTNEGEDVSRERFDRAFYAADDALVGTIPKKLSLAKTVELLSRAIGEGLRVRDKALPERVAARFCEDARENLSRSAELLEALRPRYRLGVVSNFYGNLAEVCREAGIGSALSAAVDSTEVGCTKPDPAIFRAALSRLDAGAADTVFIGDSLERDMAGARGVGMRHVLLGGETDRSRVGCCPGDPVIRRLGDLREMLP